MASVGAAAGAQPPLQRLGRYELIARIAGGGMATVHVGRARGAGGFARLVAIKVCHPHLREDRAFTAMFLDEARLAAQIHHPNVVGTLDVADEDDALYLVMDYVEGDRLLGLLRASHARGERVPLPVALAIVRDVLAGLHAAHELRDAAGRPLELIHRDVSPHNVLVGVDGITRLADFGIAKAAARAAATTREGELKGKLPYMAPEQLRREPADRRVDVFAAGVVLWEVLTGEPLFHGESELATLQNVLERRVPAPSTYARRPGEGEVPPALDALVLRALARDPAARFATALAMSEALEACGVPPAAPRAVAVYVEALVGDAVAKRRETVRRAVLAADEGAAGAHTEVRARGEERDAEDASDPGASEPGATARGVVTTRGARSAARESSPSVPRGAAQGDAATGALAAPSARVRPAWLALLALLLLGGGALVALAATRAGRTGSDPASRADAAPPRAASGATADAARGAESIAGGAQSAADAGTAASAPIERATDGADAAVERRGGTRRGNGRRRGNEYEPSGI